MDIMRGDAYPVYVDLKQDGKILTPDMISELEICVGTSLRKLYSDGGVRFDVDTSQWYIRLTQEETLRLPLGNLTVIGRIQYPEPKDDVIGIKLGTINVIDTNSRAVL